MSLEELIPCGEQILVRRDPPELRCGELVVPDTAALGITTSGVILRVGPRAHGFAQGDRVIFGILAGRKLGQEGKAKAEEEVVMIPAGDILCKVWRMRDGMALATPADVIRSYYASP